MEYLYGGPQPSDLVISINQLLNEEELTQSQCQELFKYLSRAMFISYADANEADVLFSRALELVIAAHVRTPLPGFLKTVPSWVQTVEFFSERFQEPAPLTLEVLAQSPASPDPNEEDKVWSAYLNTTLDYPSEYTIPEQESFVYLLSQAGASRGLPTPAALLLARCDRWADPSLSFNDLQQRVRDYSDRLRELGPDACVLAGLKAADWTVSSNEVFTILEDQAKLDESQGVTPTRRTRTRTQDQPPARVTDFHSWVC